ncbi:MAG: mechanosensitive ion channel [Arachnia propionica]|uniref:mechanosensitive ion channel family protein n=1 Tax=Arachnia propionica TaxID=1750 RepID=UPI00270DD372|nr:mechanosensitive ion channel [Arachnia propionica]
MWPQDDSPAEVALDLLSVVGHAIAGFLIGAVASIVISVVMGRLVRRNDRLSYLSRNLKTPQRVFLLLLGTGLGIAVATGPLPFQPSPDWRPYFMHGFLIVMILATASVLSGVIGTIQDGIIARNSDAVETTHFRRVRTQMQVISRVGVGVVWLGACAASLLTFDQFRAIGASVLASAGVLSLVVGLAAQSSLTNVFAGIQIAMTDALRVGDIVVADGNQGKVEEITLTYVVIKSWDERRWIMPSTLFTSQTFENWTRLEPKLLGVVEFDLDWLAPVEAMRIELQRILQASPLWDGRECQLQVTNAVGGTVRLRAVVSASAADKLWDLRCHLRERLIHWLQSEAVYALPRTRLEPETTTAPSQDVRRDFLEQTRAEWEAEQADLTETQVLPPTKDGPPVPQEEETGRHSWLKALRRSLS